jgi:hypothetical protein
MLDRDSLKNPQDALQNLSRISLDDVIRVRIIKHGASLYGVASQWTPEVHERIPNTAHAIEPTEILLREPSDSKSLLKEFAASGAFKVIAPGGVELGGHHALDERDAECCGRHKLAVYEAILSLLQQLLR